MNYLKYIKNYLISVLTIHILTLFYTNVIVYAISFEEAVLCENLQLGQYICKEPIVDVETQSEENCDKLTKTVPVECMPAANVTCKSSKYGGAEVTFNGTTPGFYKNVSCRWTNGHSFETALLLSVFLGMFGIDRFYLGYPAIGLLKFSTLGFFFLGQLVDILLIAAQVVMPSDGSDYIIDYYGARVTRISMNEETYIQPSDS